MKAKGMPRTTKVPVTGIAASASDKGPLHKAAKSSRTLRRAKAALAAKQKDAKPT